MILSMKQIEINDCVCVFALLALQEWIRIWHSQTLCMIIH